MSIMLCVAKQNTKYYTPKVLNSTDEFLKELDSIITKKYYKDTSDTMIIAFSIKIDSTGEIQSVHILKSNNVVEDYIKIFQIFKAIENKFTLPILYLRYKHELTNYAYFDILYKGSLIKKCNDK